MRRLAAALATHLQHVCIASHPHPSVSCRQSAQAGLAALLTSTQGSGDAATEAVQVQTNLFFSACVLL